MHIVVICEGQTERAFREILRSFLDTRYAVANQTDSKVGLKFSKQDGLVPHGDKLRRLVQNHLRDSDTIGVVVLKDVYPEHRSTTEALEAMNADLSNLERTYAHVACHDFEAWLLPYWSVILKRIGINHNSFGIRPEEINHEDPPAHRLERLYRLAKPRPRSYSKPIEATQILKGQDLSVAASLCPELKGFLNTLLSLAGLPYLT